MKLGDWIFKIVVMAACIVAMTNFFFDCFPTKMYEASTIFVGLICATTTLNDITTKVKRKNDRKMEE